MEANWAKIDDYEIYLTHGLSSDLPLAFISIRSNINTVHTHTHKPTAKMHWTHSWHTTSCTLAKPYSCLAVIKDRPKLAMCFFDADNYWGHIIDTET